MVELGKKEPPDWQARTRLRAARSSSAGWQQNASAALGARRFMTQA